MKQDDDVLESYRRGNAAYRLNLYLDRRDLRRQFTNIEQAQPSVETLSPAPSHPAQKCTLKQGLATLCRSLFPCFKTNP